MLFPDVAHGNLFAFAIGDGDAKDSFAQEDSSGMVPKGAMPKIREEGFGLVKPVVDEQVVLGPAAKFSCAAFCMPYWVRHDYTS